MPPAWKYLIILNSAVLAVMIAAVPYLYFENQSRQHDINKLQHPESVQQKQKEQGKGGGAQSPNQQGQLPSRQ